MTKYRIGPIFSELYGLTQSFWSIFLVVLGEMHVLSEAIKDRKIIYIYEINYFAINI